MECSKANYQCEVPIYSLSEEEFTDPIKFIRKIYPSAANYGICKIRPPDSWKPPFAVNDTKFTFTPRIQKLSDVSASNRERTNFTEALINFWELKDVVVYDQYVKGKQIDIFKLYKYVKEFGGYDSVCHQNNWAEICRKLGFDAYPAIASAICSKYRKILLPFENFNSSKPDLAPNVIDKNVQNMHSAEGKINYFACKKCNKVVKPDQMLVCDECCNIVYHTFCLDMPLSYIPKKWLCPKCFTNQFNKKKADREYGFCSSNNTYTLRKFSNMADDFKKSYFKKPLTTITLPEVRDEFWRLVGDGNCEITVEYGADLNSSKTGSGFPTTGINKTTLEYCSSPWNLNNFAKNPLSALQYLPNDISGMKVPWCYVGMVFSCFCWHTEDHWSFSINYLHEGDCKTWYAVPGASAEALEAAVRAEAPELFVQSPDLLHHMTTMVSPERLEAHGVPVYTCSQLAGEFVVTFPRAYHAGFNNGYNFAEAVNFCPAEWFPFGFNCVDHYALLHRPPVFSHAELLCRLAQDIEMGDRESSRPPPISLILAAAEQFPVLLAKERTLRSHLIHVGVRRTERRTPEQSPENFSEVDVLRECQLCKTALFTSALTCSCSKSMLCLEHYQSCTCCPPERQILIYRYCLDELSQFAQRPKERIQEFQQWKTLVEDFLLTARSPPQKSIKEDDQRAEVEKMAEMTDEAANKNNPQSEESSAESVTIKNESRENTSKSRMSLQELINLRDKGLRNGYPDDLIDSLSVVIAEVEECVDTIRALCHLKRDEDRKPGELKPSSPAESSPRKQASFSSKKSRKEMEWSLECIVEPDLPGTPELSKLTEHQFELFVEKVNKLPCAIPEIDELNLLKQRINEWHVSALEMLSLSCQSVNRDKEGDTDFTPIPTLPELQQVEDLVDFGRSIDVELKPLLPLRHVLECLSWLNIAKSTMNLSTPPPESSEDTGEEGDRRPTLKRLLDIEARGQMLTYYLRHYGTEDMKGEATRYETPWDSDGSTTTALELAVSRCSSRLLAAISATQFLEASIKKLLKMPHGSCQLSEAEALVAQVANVLGTFSASEELANMCTKAQRLMDHLDCFQSLIDHSLLPNQERADRSGDQDVDSGNKMRLKGDTKLKLSDEFVSRIKLNTPESTPRVWFDFYNEVCRAAKRLPFVFPNTSKVKNLLVAANRCYERLRTAFMPFEDEANFDVELFLGAVLPRPVLAYAILIYRDRNHLQSNPLVPDPGDCSREAYVDACRENVSEFMKHLNSGKSFDHLYDAAYSPMIEGELKMLHCLRRLNLRKSQERDQERVVYCVCRQPGYSGLMLQCELCREWFHKRCVGFLSKNVDIRRLRYICPHCERTNRPELAEVISIMKELVPHFLSTEEDVKVDEQEDSSNFKSSIGSEMITCLSSVPLLLKFPLLTAIQMACERAFTFARRAKRVIGNEPQLRELLSEYEGFFGVQMQWSNYNEPAILATPVSAARKQRRNQTNPSLTRSHLPLNVIRPPGMQPLVLRTSAPRSLVTSPEDRLQQIRHQQQQQQSSEGPFQHLADRIHQTSHETNKTDDSEVSESKKKLNKETAFTLAVMSTTPTNFLEPPTDSKPASPPFSTNSASPPYITHKPRCRNPSGETNRSSMSYDAEYHHPRFRMPTGSMPPPFEFRFSLRPEARYYLDNLLCEACALELSMPQTRWLWQLNLAVDSDFPGALHPRIVFEEETAMRRRVERRRGFVSEEVVRRPRPRRQSFLASSGRPFYAALAHSGRDSALDIDKYEHYSKKRRIANNSRSESMTSQRRRGKMGAATASVSQRQFASKSFWEPKEQDRQTEFCSGEERESDNREKEDENEEIRERRKIGEKDEPVSPSMKQTATFTRSRSGRAPRGFETKAFFHSEEENKASSTHCRLPAFRSPGYRDRRSIGRGAASKHPGDYRSLVKAALRDVIFSQAAARRFAASRRESVRASVPRSRGGGRPRGGLSRQQQRRRPGQEQTESTAQHQQLEEIEEELCEAPGGCKRPNGNVNWVACDQCDSWYHQRCVGIMSVREVPDVYVCSNCQANNELARIKASKSQRFRLGRGGRWKKLSNEICVSEDEDEEMAVDENPSLPKQARLASPENDPANMVATSVDEDEGAEALLEAIAVLDAVPASELEGTWTREVTANSSLSHQTEPGSKLDEPSAD